MRSRDPEPMEAFPSEEAPTVSISKPVLDLLARKTSESEVETVRAMPVAAILVALEAPESRPPLHVVEVESKPAIAGTELEPSESRVRLNAPLAAEEADLGPAARIPVSGVTSRATLTVAVFVLVAGVLGTCLWLFVGGWRGAEPWVQRVIELARSLG